jgi:DNA-binding LacI/PurR family transcriptional regulator
MRCGPTTLRRGMENRFPTKVHTRPATIQDVANAASVSKGTVSKFLSNTPYVAEPTKRRIEAAIRELDFQPSALAQSLSRRRSFTIGVVVASLRNPFYPDLITGVEDAIEPGGYTLLLATTDANAEREKRIVRSMQQRRVEGMVIAAARSRDQEVRRLRSTGMNVVLAGRGLADVGFDTVVLDNRAGAALAVRHLIDHGHRRIAHIAGPQDITPFRDRLEGYRGALRDAGLSCDDALVVATSPEPSTAEGATSVIRLMELDEPPTAVFTANDNIAMGVVSACQQRGWRVPDDLAVIGFDDVWVDSLMAVPLTSVDGRAVDIGREAGALLATRIASSHAAPEDAAAFEPAQVVLQPNLVTRRSCGCVPVA